MLTKEQLHELFDYRDGELYWKVRTSNRITIGDKAGCICPDGYKNARVNGVLYGVHRLIFLMHNGWMPVEIDHLDLNKANNAIENLRALTRSQNNYNVGIKSNNTSGIKGVSWLKSRNKWLVQVTHTKGKFVVYIKDLDLAELVAIEARNKFHGEFARHN